MSAQILECPECERRFRYESDGAYPEYIVCPECGRKRPSMDFSALVFCTQCNTKLSVPLDIIGEPDLMCPKCGAGIVIGEDSLRTTFGEDLSTFDGMVESRHQMFQRMLNDGDQFDKYRIIRLLGHGGMAEVYLAEHLLLNQKCALKLMRSGLNSGDPVFIKRFVREARLTHKFNHPNIVKVFDAGSDSKTGYLFIAMEYVEGKTLQELLKDGPLPEKMLLEVLESMIMALKVLHNAGVVHRDIKPSNIMLTKDGLYKLMDLGIAKTDSGQQGEMTLTMDQAAIGTPGYASPEQCQSAHLVDIRSDIYCLGATMYHLASGKVPFTGNTPLEVIINVLQSETVPLKKYRPDLSTNMLKIIESMMMKNPDDRPADPAALEKMIARRFHFNFKKWLKRFLRFLTLVGYSVLIVALLGIAAYFYVTKFEQSFDYPDWMLRLISANPPNQIRARYSMKPTGIRGITRIPDFWLTRDNSKANGGSIEERIEHVNRRLSELKKDLVDNVKSDKQAWLNKKFRTRIKQLRRLNEQLAVRERAKHLDKSNFDTARMENFKQKFAEHTGDFRSRGHYQTDMDFARWVLDELKSGKIDPNIEVVDSMYREHSGSLLKCVTSGSVRLEAEIARQLIKMGADTSNIMNAPGPYEKKALDIVIAEGGCNTMNRCLMTYLKRRPIPEEQVTKILYLDHRIDETDNDGNTVLHHAARAGAKDIVELLLLLDADAYVNTRNKQGETPIFSAMKSDQQAIYNMLIEAGADPNIKNQGGQKAADMADIGRFQYAVSQERLQDAEDLLKKGISPNTRFSDDYTALQTACRRKNYQMVKLLLDYGADPNLGCTKRDREFYPLQLAFDKSQSRDAKIFSLLLKKGANPNIPPIGWGNDRSILSHMCDQLSGTQPDDREFLDALLADPRTSLETEHYGRGGTHSTYSMFFLALSNQRPAWFVKMILDKTASFELWDPVVVMAILSDYPDDVIKTLIEKGANVNATYAPTLRASRNGPLSNRETTALYEAVKRKRLNTVKMLLDSGADADWKSPKGESIRELDTTAQIRALLK